MNKEQAVSYLRFSGFSDEQIKAIEEAFTCEDAINRAELLKAIDTWDKFGYTETGCFVREPKNDCVKYIHYDDVIECIKGMSPVNPQEPKTDWIVSIILTDEKGEEHDGLMDMRRMLIYLHNIPAETAMSLGYTWKSAEGSDKE